MSFLISAPLNDPLWIKVSKSLIEEKEYKFLIASHIKPEINSKKFQENFVDLCQLNDLSVDLKWDKQTLIQDYINPKEYLSLKGIYTNSTHRCGIKRIDPIVHDIKFNKLLNRLLNFLINKRIKIICFDLVPHLPWEVISWELIRILGGKSFCFKRTGICDAIYIEQEIYGNESSPFSKLTTKHPICKYQKPIEIIEYIEKKDISKFQSKGEIKNSINHENSFFKNKLNKIKSLILNIVFFKYIYFLLVAIKYAIRNQYKSYKVASPETRDNSTLILKDFKTRLHLMIYLIKYIFSSIINELFLINLVKKDKKDISKIINKKYIYFALHLQPESTTFPQSLYWNNVYTAMKIIRSNFKDIPIIIKEHPRQYNFDLRTYTFRSRDFYRNLKGIKKVFFINTNFDSLELIEKSFLVAGINGTNLWEALKFGKPTIMLTKQIHSNMENCITISEMKNKKFHNKIKMISGWDNQKVLLSIANWTSKNKNSFIHAGLYWRYIKIFMKGDYTLASKNIKNGIIDFCKMYQNG